MKKRTVNIIALLAAACLVACFAYAFFTREAEPVPADAAAMPTAEPTPKPTVEPSSAPTSAPTPTAAPTPTPEPTNEPTPAPEPPLLVNFDHPIFEEPPVVALNTCISADNVTFDERRHADKTAALALNRMLMAAEREGDFGFIIASAFRSIEEQEILWSMRRVSDPHYGDDPYNEPVIVMPPNCSEHATGLAFDILCDSCPHASERFESTPEGQWLMSNAHRFGFILRFPKDKEHLTGVIYEPWHYRYVGVEAATYIYEHGMCLEEYVEYLAG